MKIFFDFDDVLFNSKQFKEDYFSIFKKRGVSRKIFEACYYDPLDERNIKLYDPMGHIKRVCSEIGIDVTTLEAEISAFVADTSDYVFADVVGALARFQRKQLCIVSFSTDRRAHV